MVPGMVRYDPSPSPGRAETGVQRISTLPNLMKIRAISPSLDAVSAVQPIAAFGSGINHGLKCRCVEDSLSKSSIELPRIGVLTPSVSTVIVRGNDGQALRMSSKRNFRHNSYSN